MLFFLPKTVINLSNAETAQINSSCHPTLPFSFRFFDPLHRLPKRRSFKNLFPRHRIRRCDIYSLTAACGEPSRTIEHLPALSAAEVFIFEIPYNPTGWGRETDYSYIFRGVIDNY